MKLVQPQDPLWPAMSRVADRVTDYAAEVLPHLPGMMGVVERKKALGLAAPQVGVALRFFIFRASRGDRLEVVVNPEITWRSEDLRTDEEGCLSFPGRFVDIARPESVRVRYTNRVGTEVAALFGGMGARVFQHELDHLDGRTIFPT